MVKNPVTKKPAARPAAETGQQKFERLLSQNAFEGLKAILGSLPVDRAVLCAEVKSAKSYEGLLAKLGYPVVQVKQVHVQDCYSRLGPEGGIRVVLPYHDIATYSTLPTVVNFDCTVTTTPKSVAFFNDRLMELKSQLVK